MATSQLHILLVEDDDVDVEYMVRGFRQQGFPLPLRVACNGLEALSILRTSHEDGHGPAWIVITDLNMPRMNGLELLSELRCNPQLRCLAVFVLSSSNLDRDIWAAYNQQVAGYLLKANLDQQLPQLCHLLVCYQALVVFPLNYTTPTLCPQDLTPAAIS